MKITSLKLISLDIFMEEEIIVKVNSVLEIKSMFMNFQKYFLVRRSNLSLLLKIILLYSARVTNIIILEKQKGSFLKLQSLSNSILNTLLSQRRSHHQLKTHIFWQITIKYTHWILINLFEFLNKYFLDLTILVSSERVLTIWK